MLDTLAQSLDEFDQAVERGAEGRRVHIGAWANLMAISDEVIQLVWILDGYNCHRLAADPNLLAAWTSARNVIGPVRAGEPADQIEPAA